MERSFDDLPNLYEYNSNYCTANYSYHGGRDIEVSFYQSKFYTHDNLIKLKNIKDQITSLSMQNMPLKDEDILFIATLSHLKKLNLNYTSLKINQLGPLQNLKELKPISFQHDRFRDSRRNSSSPPENWL